jgi:iron complex transport system substrate-binding protein
VLATITTVGHRMGVPDRAEDLVGSLRARLAAVAARVAGRRRPRVAVVEWVDPPFPAAHWVPDQVVAAGGEAVACRPGQRSVPVDWDFFRAADPEVVVVAPCGFGLSGAVDQAAAVAAALPGRPVWAIDGDAVVVRPGPRLVDGVETMAALLHPEPGDEPPLSAVRVA